MMNARERGEKVGITEFKELRFLPNDQKYLLKFIEEQDAKGKSANMLGKYLDVIEEWVRTYNCDIEKLKSSRQGFSLSSFAVLYRTNAQSRSLEEAFLAAGIPYILVGGVRFYERREIKDLIAYLRSIVNPADWVSVERIVNVPARSLGANSWKKIEAQCRSLGVTYLDLAADQLPQLRPQQHEAFQKFQALMKSLNQKIDKLTPSQSL